MALQVQPVLRAELLARSGRQWHLRQRMADEFGSDAVLAIELLFEWKDHKHLSDILANQLDTRLSPCPQLRTDVIDHRNSTLVEFAREPEIEVRKVDENRRIRLSSVCFGD